LGGSTAGAKQSAETPRREASPVGTLGVMAGAVVSADLLTKRFGSLTAVDGLSFELAPGTVTGFLGPNGAGKTTTLRMLLGIAAPSHGRALVFGRPYRDLPEPSRRVGAVLEASDFHPGRRGRDHLRSIALAAGIPTARADEVLRMVELEGAARRRVKTYSLGMRQRLALATALLGDPDLLVLDEPANGLDPEGVRWLRDFLRAFAAEGKTVFVSSHVLAEVAQTVDRVLIINRGKLVTESPLDELTARVAGAVHVRTPQREQLEQILHAAGLQTTALDRGELLVAGASSAKVGELAAGGGIVLHELAQEAGTLEEVFLDLTAGAPA
jgi:ABC-2 type transport system ATP-binding protein